MTLSDDIRNLAEESYISLEEDLFHKWANEVKQLEQENETLRQYIYHSGAIAPCRCCTDKLGFNPLTDPETTFPSEPE